MAIPEPPGDPQLVFGPLRIWILGREFPDIHDYWDGNSVTGSSSQTETEVRAGHLR